MEVATFNDDLLELIEFANRLEKFIDVEHHFIEGGLVLALSSKFGAGKTTFLSMWKKALEDRADDESKPMVITLNAWESDYYGDPLFAIVSSLIEALQKDGESAKSLIEAAKDVGWIATAIGGQVAKKFTGIDAVAAGDLAEKKKAKRDGANILDSFSVYEERKKAMNQLQDAIREFVASSKPRVLFLVDELDRCRPDYAISYLETIKHIFDVQGAVFILAADRNQLENSARTAFGANLDFEEYFRKFVHREISLPPITEAGYSRLASAYASHYLEREGLRSCFMEVNSYRIKNIAELIAGLRLTPRQIQEVFRVLGHSLEAPEDKKGRLFWCVAVGTIAMAAFKIGNRRAFELLGSKQCAPLDALDFLRDILGDDHIDWWFTLFLTGGGLKVPESSNAKSVMIEVGLMMEDEESSRFNDLGQWIQGWGRSTEGRFSQIKEKVDQIAQWN
jgi:hypothetical protein